MKRLLIAVLIVLFSVFPAQAGKVVPAPQIPEGAKVMDVNAIFCPDSRIIEITTYDLDNDEDADLRVFSSGENLLGFVWYAPGPTGAPVRFVFKYRNGVYEEITRDELGRTTPCDLPLQIKEAPAVKM